MDGEYLSLYFDRDGIAHEYDDQYDITIHCESQEDRDKVIAILNRTWIPCSEQLPETDDKVLCCTLTKKGVSNIIVGYYLAGADRWVSGMNGNVVAWMPLPEPYEEK